MGSHITVHLLVSLETVSHKFGTKYELHTCIYFNHQGKPFVRRSYWETRTRQGSVFCLPDGVNALKDTENSALVAPQIL